MYDKVKNSLFEFGSA